MLEMIRVFHGSDHIVKQPAYLGGKADNDYGVLAWIAEVAANRGTEQEATAIVAERLIANYRIDTTECDIIKGYRADDSYTQVIEAFLLNQINLYEVERLFYKGSLGNQIFLKSEEAFRRIEWIDSYMVALQDSDKQADYFARYAVQNRLIYNREGNCYEQPGV